MAYHFLLICISLLQTLVGCQFSLRLNQRIPPWARLKVFSSKIGDSKFIRFFCRTGGDFFFTVFCLNDLMWKKTELVWMIAFILVFPIFIFFVGANINWYRFWVCDISLSVCFLLEQIWPQVSMFDSFMLVIFYVFYVSGARGIWRDD